MRYQIQITQRTNPDNHKILYNDTNRNEAKKTLSKVLTEIEKAQDLHNKLLEPPKKTADNTARRNRLYNNSRIVTVQFI